jgi:hypothetical protein
MKTGSKFLLLGTLYAFACVLRNEEAISVKTYYENGNLKTDFSMVGGDKHGVCKYYYESGSMSYEGNFSRDLKIGWQIEYFAYPPNAKRHEAFYDTLNGKSFVLENTAYDSTGQWTFKWHRVKRRLEVKIVDVVRYVDDSVKFTITILNPQFEYTEGYVQNIDSLFTPLDSISPVFFTGREHSVEMRTSLMNVGRQRISGAIRDFDIVEISDTIGVTDAHDTFFQFYVTVIQRKDI